jgi:hypothetical protein
LDTHDALLTPVKRAQQDSRATELGLYFQIISGLSQNTQLSMGMRVWYR